MKRHYYAFGSVCRGEIDPSSDIDLLAISDASSALDSDRFSIYSYDRIEGLWAEGNPFAWHLHAESRLLHASDGVDFLAGLGEPMRYTRSCEDCQELVLMLRNAEAAIRTGTNSVVFELSVGYLAARNFATCYALGQLSQLEFSRRSPLRLGEMSLRIGRDTFRILERARLLATRGWGKVPTPDECRLAADSFTDIESWMLDLLRRASLESLLGSP